MRSGVLGNRSPERWHSEHTRNLTAVILGMRLQAVERPCRMTTMNFEWDSAKAERNRRKHGVSFSEAATVLGDPLSVTYPDPDHSMREQRFITVGMGRTGRVLIVAHTDLGGNIRIISARQVTRRERAHYEETH